MADSFDNGSKMMMVKDGQHRGPHTIKGIVEVHTGKQQQCTAAVSFHNDEAHLAVMLRPDGEVVCLVCDVKTGKKVRFEGKVKSDK